MAEVNKPLKDWELSRLAQRMSPREFEQIAVGYLGLPKVEDIFVCLISLMYCDITSVFNIAQPNGFTCTYL